MSSSSKSVNKTVPSIPNMDEFGLGYKLLGMEPYIAMFNGPERLGIKVVKILDFNWFPHMRPELYSEELCFNMEKKIGKKMRKEAKWIPFA